MEATRKGIPRDTDDDYTREAAEQRQAFITEETGADLEHVSSYSFDPSILQGNVENFTGVAQVPIGFAGPLLVDGEHAQGEFYVPLATAEGTLVASYNRGMRLLYEAGGVKTTVLDDRMQRAPAFLFADAREARTFADWLDERFDDIREAAEATTRSGKLQDIDKYSASRILFCRFNFTTGDAAGQNLTGKATQAACEWIKENYDGALDHYFLESNFATDKKSSQVNILRTRGKRVVAEATIPRDLIKELMHADVDMLWRARLVSNLGGFMSGVNNNGAGRGERGRVIRRAELQRGPAERPLLRLDHDPLADRRDLRRRHRPRHTARVPRGARLLRQGQGHEAGGDRHRDGPLRRAVAGLGDRCGAVGARPRPARPQPAVISRPASLSPARRFPRRGPRSPSPRRS